MNEELQKWYEAQFDLFSEQGYKDLINQVKEIVETYENLRNLGTTDLQYRKGQLDILDWFVNWQSSVEAQYKELTQ